MYIMDVFNISATMYFNDNQMAVIVVECGVEPGRILPKNWNLNCILTFIIRKKLV